MFGARATEPDVAVDSRDKSLQKERIRAAGLPTAPVRRVATLVELAASPEGTRDPFPVVVIKPAHGVAARATAVARSALELNRYVRRLLRDGTPPVTSFVVEEYVDHDAEWHLDGVVRGGLVEFLSVGRYLRPRLHTASGATSAEYLLDRERHADSYLLADRFAQACLSALGVTAGVFHLEAFHRAEGLTFGECAVRPGGNGIGDVISLKYGLDFVGAGVDAMLDRPVTERPLRRPDAVGYTTLPSLPGVVSIAPTTAELLNRPGVRSGSIKAVRGVTMSDMRRENRPFGGLAVLSAVDEDTLLEHLDGVVSWYADNTIVSRDDGDQTLSSLGASLDCAFAVRR